jgi:hypothetical protein
MGLYYSTPAAVTVPIVEDKPKVQTDTQGITSGVRVTGDAAFTDIEDKLREAYEKGKAEAQAGFQGALEMVAAQVYENVQSQLSNIQKDSLEKSDKLVRTLHNMTLS